MFSFEMRVIPTTLIFAPSWTVENSVVMRFSSSWVGPATNSSALGAIAQPYQPASSSFTPVIHHVFLCYNVLILFSIAYQAMWTNDILLCFLNSIYYWRNLIGCPGIFKKLPIFIIFSTFVEILQVVLWFKKWVTTHWKMISRKTYQLRFKSIVKGK